MGQEYDHHSIQAHHHHNFHQKRLFLPIFCRLSIKDINLNNHHNIPIAADGDPTSPKVSCMGQVKRNNRITGFPAAVAAGSPITTHHHKYSKLKKLFSSKTLLPPHTSSAAGGGRSGSNSCRSRREMCLSNLRRLKKCEAVDIGELDPPLPVVKRASPPDEVNIWKRRFNGAALKSLQIEEIHLPNSNSQPPTV